MQFTKRSESVSHLVSEESTKTSLFGKETLLKFTSKRRLIWTGSILVGLVIFSIIIWSITARHTKANEVTNNPEKQEAENLIDVTTPTVHISAASKTTKQEFSTQSITEMNLHLFKKRINKVEHEYLEKISMLQTDLANISDQLVETTNTMATLSRNLSILEDKVTQLTTTAAQLNSTVTSLRKQFHNSKVVLNQSITETKQLCTADLNEFKQEIDSEISKNRSRFENSWRDFKNMMSFSVKRCDEEILELKHMINSSAAAASSNISTHTEQLMLLEIQRLKDNLNASISAVTIHLTSKQSEDKNDLLSRVRTESDELRNRILAVEDNLQMSLHRSIFDKEDCLSNISFALARYSVKINQTVASCVENEKMERVSQQNRLKNALDEQTKKSGKLQDDVTKLNNQVTRNTASVAKWQHDFETFNSKLQGKASAGWIQMAGGYAYFVTKERMNWVEAQTACQGLNAHLAYGGLRMNDFMYQRIFRQVVQPLRKTVWIGLNDMNQEGRWQWNDGKRLTLSEQQWRSGQPNNYKEQDCAEIDDSGKWGDFSCAGRVTANALCEKKISA